jgi:hypothetical protein
MNSVIHLAHVIITLINVFYGFFMNQYFDTLYIFYNILVFLSWTFHDGICPISIYYDKYNNIKSTDYSNDLLELVGGNKKLYTVISYALMFITTLSIIIVYNRNHIPKLITYTFILLAIIYFILIKYNTKNTIFFIVQTIFKVYCFFLFGYFILKKIE